MAWGSHCFPQQMEREARGCFEAYGTHLLGLITLAWRQVIPVLAVGRQIANMRR